jgi:uncharacterized protein YbjT (DUF2867 family)
VAFADYQQQLARTGCQHCAYMWPVEILHGDKVRLPPVLFQPMAADDVASAVGRIAVGPPVNGTVEIAGPEQFRLDELVRERLATLKDPREVIADPEALYAGAKVSLRTLMPDNRSRLCY